MTNSEMHAYITYDVLDDMFHVTITVPRKEIIDDPDGVNTRLDAVVVALKDAVKDSADKLAGLGDTFGDIQGGSHGPSGSETFN